MYINNYVTFVIFTLSARKSTCLVFVVVFPFFCVVIYLLFVNAEV